MSEEKEMVVCYACDDKFAKIAGISLLSLLKNNIQASRIRVYILDDGITDGNKERLASIAARFKREINFVGVADFLAKLEKKGASGYAVADGNMTTYARLNICALIPDAKRILYLDCDTLVLSDIRPLFELDMQKKPLAMGYDCLRPEYKNYIGFSGKDAYYNAGVLLIDTEKWRERKCYETVMSHVDKHGADYVFVDQDVLNILLREEIALLPAGANVLSQCYLYPYGDLKRIYRLDPYYGEKDFEKAMQAPVVAHFCGFTFGRPWYANSRHPLKKVYDRYYNESPWGKEKQEQVSVPLVSRVEAVLYEHAPKKIAAWAAHIARWLFYRRYAAKKIR